MSREKYFALVTVIASLLFAGACGNKSLPPTVLRSPDGAIKLELRLASNGADRDYPVYSVTFRGMDILNDSKLGVVFQNSGEFKTGLQIQTVSFDARDETYPVHFGKTAEARDHFREMTVTLRERKSPKRELQFVFRAYNDGIAFRYIFPRQSGLTDFVITSENSEFAFAGNPVACALPLAGFTTSYENNYVTLPLPDITPDSLIGMPFLVEFPSAYAEKYYMKGVWAAVTEADLTDYAGMYLTGSENKPGTLTSSLSPWPENPEVKVKGRTPARSPWRVVMIGDDPGRLIESNIVLNLNEPFAINDPSWIVPGKVAFLWWNDFVVTGEDFEGGMNTETMKYYIDYCARNKIQFIHIDTDEKNDWYGPHHNRGVDITKPIPELDMDEVMRHAREKGVGVCLWVQWQMIRDQMEKAFPVYQQWGISGLKIDYMDRDDQEMVNFYHAVIKKAAEHRLTVNFHGAYKPTGMRRTYPNLITREGVLGLEYSKWSEKCNPEHELMIPFTRMLAGPMDFTPGAFRTVTKEDFKPVFHAPVAMGTRCHQLAMYVVYESPRQMVSDYPAAYEGQMGFEFIRNVPTVWDDTKVLNAKVGDYITIARRHGDTWYIGAMTDWTPRELQIPLGFLPGGTYAVDIFSDGPDADKVPAQVVHEKFNVTHNDAIIARLAPGGGHVAILTPIMNPQMNADKNVELR